MRLVPLIFACVMIAGGPVGAQELAAASAKADCPPGEPDSLEISWNTPCDSGDWLFDTQSGCRMWDWHPAPEDRVVWKGACLAGRPNGQGQARWSEHGLPIDRFQGTYRDGRREGVGRYDWNDTVSYEGGYAGDVPEGYGVVRIGALVLRGNWHKGCLAADGKVVAIGVPRESCTAPPASGQQVAQNQP